MVNVAGKDDDIAAGVVSGLATMMKGIAAHDMKTALDITHMIVDSAIGMYVAAAMENGLSAKELNLNVKLLHTIFENQKVYEMSVKTWEQVMYRNPREEV